MDKAYKKLKKKAKKIESESKSLEKQTDVVLEKDHKRDKFVEKGKKAMKGKC